MENLNKQTIALIRALRERDDNTAEHSDRTCALALELGRACALSAADLETLALVAHLHDIGKIGIPDRVLLKAGRLGDDEMAVMKSHSRRGHDILTSVPDRDIAAVAVAVLHHHESFDGDGYPDQLKGEDIPVLSRIVALADSYDAMATTRPYHKPKTHAEIMRVLFEQHGNKYDPHVRAIFATVVENSVHRAAGE